MRTRKKRRLPTLSKPGRIDAYLARETLFPFSLTLGLVVLSVFLVQARKLARAAVGLGLTTIDALVIFVSALPPFLVLAIPIAFFFSVLVAYSRLDTDLELTALRATGASPTRLAVTPVLIGLAVSILSIPIACIGEPYGLRLLEARLVDVGLKNMTEAIRPGVFAEAFPNTAVLVENKRSDGLLEKVLFFDGRNSDQAILVTAEKGRFEKIGKTSVLLRLKQGEMHLGNRRTEKSYEKASFELASFRLDGGQELSGRTRFVSKLGKFTNAELLSLSKEHQASPPLSRRILKTYYRRFAFPLMGVVFGLLGAAIRLWVHRRNNAAAAILGLLSIVFYFFLTRIFDLVIVKYAGTALLGSFLPNLILTSLALLILLRAGRPRRS